MTASPILISATAAPGAIDITFAINGISTSIIVHYGAVSGTYTEQYTFTYTGTGAATIPDVPKGTWYVVIQGYSASTGLTDISTSPRTVNVVTAANQPVILTTTPGTSSFTATYTLNGLASGVIIYYGTVSGDYPFRYIQADASSGTVTVPSVPAGTWFVAIQGTWTSGGGGGSEISSPPVTVVVATSTALLPTVLSSNLGRWGIDTGDGLGLRAFPRGPADYKIYPEGDPEVHLDGTVNWSRYWIMELTFHVLTEVEYRAIASRWAPTRQKVILNYMSGRFFGSGAGAYTATSGWKKAPAVWRNPPQVGISAIRGSIVYDLVLTFNRVEWDGVL